ncbi:hypothetical protein KL944_000942 [Ogataea haglerorum]|nr:hypothetical protein KL944_000942 [Ogataea haglerorum]
MLVFVAVIFPPLPVCIKRGLCSADMLINIALCLLGYVPGLIHSWYIILKNPDMLNYDDLERQQIIINIPSSPPGMVVSRQPDRTKIQFRHPEPFQTPHSHNPTLVEQNQLSPRSSPLPLNREANERPSETNQPSQLAQNVLYGSTADYTPEEAPPSYDNVMNETAKHPNGSILATASIDRTIKLWKRSETGVTYWKTLVGHTKGISSIEFAPNSKFIASASDDLTIRIWDVEGGELVQILRGHTFHVTVLKFHYRGSILVSGSADENIRVWDLRRAKCMKVLSAHSDPISSLDFSFDGTVIVSGSYDGLIRLFDLETGQCLKTLIYDKSGSSYPVSCVTFSPNSKYILSSSLDGFVRLWDYMNNKVVKTFQNVDGGAVAEKYSLGTCFLTCFASPLVCSGDEKGKVLMWDIQSKGIVCQLDTGSGSPVMEVEPVDNGEQLLTVCMNGQIRLWQCEGE